MSILFLCGSFPPVRLNKNQHKSPVKLEVIIVPSFYIAGGEEVHESIVLRGGGGCILLMCTKQKFCCVRSLWSLKVGNKI